MSEPRDPLRRRRSGPRQAPRPVPARADPGAVPRAHPAGDRGARHALLGRARAFRDTPVRPGGRVLVGHTPIVEDVRDVPLPILARGRGWLAVDKPSGIVVHPVNAVRENSLIRMLRRQEGCAGSASGAPARSRDDRRAARRPGCGRPRARCRRRSNGAACTSEYLADRARRRWPATKARSSWPIGADDGRRVFVRREVMDGGERAVTRWRVERQLARSDAASAVPGNRASSSAPRAPRGHRPSDPGGHPLRPPRRRLPRPRDGIARCAARRRRAGAAATALRAARVPGSVEHAATWRSSAPVPADFARAAGRRRAAIIALPVSSPRALHERRLAPHSGASAPRTEGRAPPAGGGTRRAVRRARRAAAPRARRRPGRHGDRSALHPPGRGAWTPSTAGNNVLVATPTASGKSLVFAVPALTAALEGGGATSLFLYPDQGAGPGPARGTERARVGDRAAASAALRRSTTATRPITCAARSRKTRPTS